MSMGGELASGCCARTSRWSGSGNFRVADRIFCAGHTRPHETRGLTPSKQNRCTGESCRRALPRRWACYCLMRRRQPPDPDRPHRPGRGPVAAMARGTCGRRESGLRGRQRGPAASAGSRSAGQIWMMAAIRCALALARALIVEQQARRCSAVPAARARPRWSPLLREHRRARGRCGGRGRFGALAVAGAWASSHAPAMPREAEVLARPPYRRTAAGGDRARPPFGRKA